MEQDIQHMRKPWERQSDEQTRWYQRFVEYLQLGSGRTLTDAYRKERERAGKSGRKPPSSWLKASTRHDWKGRAAAYDDEQRRIVEEESIALRRKEQEELLRIRKQHRAEELELARQLRIKAEELLDQPAERVKEEIEQEDRTIVRIFVPDHQGFRTATAMVKQFSETGRAALNMPVQRSQLDIAKMTTEDLLALYEAVRLEEAEDDSSDGVETIH
ncbi:MAG: hypothetical protein AB7G75_26240 [Candidatus Binatia bacterium]